MCNLLGHIRLPADNFAVREFSERDRVRAMPFNACPPKSLPLMEVIP
jgi:hypothetical protein